MTTRLTTEQSSPTDAEFAHERERVWSCFNHWLWRTRMMGVWTVTFHWIRDRTMYEKSASDSIYDELVYFDVEASWDRRTANVGVYIANMDNLDDKELSQAVIEELMHILVNEMRMWSTSDEAGDAHCVRHEERVVSDLTRVVWGLAALAYDADDAEEAGYPWPLPETRSVAT